MNTYIIKHNGRVYKAGNIMTTRCVTKILEGGKITEYIAFGKGTGTPNYNRYSLFDRLGAKQAETVDINTDRSKGRFFIVRRIVLNPDEFVGETITELGFCAEADGDLITHCVLPEGVLKTAAPMEITAVFRIPITDGFIEGDNPLAKILLGAQELSVSKLSCGYCEYRSIQDALEIKERYPCSIVMPSLIRIDCPLEQSDKPDLVIFYDDIPVLRGDSRYYKLRTQQETFTVNPNGVAEIPDWQKLKISTIAVNSASVLGAIQAKPDNISWNFLSMPLKPDQRIFVSKDRSFLLLICENQILVYQDVLGNLVYAGELIFESKVSCVDVCATRLAVVCNQQDTPLSAPGRRLHFYQLTSSRLLKREVTGDLPTDAQAISLEYAGGTNMVLYYLYNGVLTGVTFSFNAPAPVYNCSYNVNRATFIKTSYRRNIVTATDLGSGLESCLHMALLNRESYPLSGAVFLALKSIEPDQINNTGEVYASLSVKNKSIAVYSYVSNTTRISQLGGFMEDIQYAFLDGQYIIIADQNRNYKILEIDTQTSKPFEITSGILPCDPEEVHIMCDLMLIKSQDKLYYARIQSDKGWLFSDQFAYGDQALVRFNERADPIQNNQSACAMVLNVLIA